MLEEQNVWKQTSGSCSILENEMGLEDAECGCVRASCVSWGASLALSGPLISLCEMPQ